MAFLFFCALSPYKNLSFLPSIILLSSFLLSPTLPLYSPSFLNHSLLLLFAALLPNLVAYHSSHWLCSHGPAMTVSFTRVSPVSSLSLCQPIAPTPWSSAQPQQRPTEEQHDHICVSRWSPGPFDGMNTFVLITELSF